MDAGLRLRATSARNTPPSMDLPAEITTQRQRAVGRVALSVAHFGERSGVVRLAESGSARIRLPRTREAPVEAVLINTAGGIAAGDRFDVELEVAAGAHLVAATTAAEKIYKSDGAATAAIATRISVRSGGTAEWLPQETILFDRARLRRSLEVEVDADAAALLFEAVVFGRAASGETVRTGLFTDRWRIRRGGRLVLAETLRLDGPVADLLARPAMAAGARALATLLYVAPESEARLEEARAGLDGSGSECGASAWDGMLAVRWLAPDIGTLRRDAARFMNRFRGRPLPRVWHL